MPPASVSKDNEKSVFDNLYNPKLQSKVLFKFSLGDTERILKLEGVFRKGYKQSFTEVLQNNNKGI